MKHVHIGPTLGLSIAAVILSPIVLIFSVPLAVGIGLDLFDWVGEMPMALALCGPGVFLLLRWVLPSPPARWFATVPARSRLPLGRAGELDYAP